MPPQPPKAHPDPTLCQREREKALARARHARYTTSQQQQGIVRASVMIPIQYRRYLQELAKRWREEERQENN